MMNIHISPGSALFANINLSSGTEINYFIEFLTGNPLNTKLATQFYDYVRDTPIE